MKKHKQKKVFRRDFILKRIVKIAGNGRTEVDDSSNTEVLTAYKMGLFQKEIE